MLALKREIVSRESLGSYSKLLWRSVFFVLSILISGSIAKFYSQPMNKKIRELLFKRRQQDSTCQNKILTSHIIRLPFTGNDDRNLLLQLL